MFNSRREKRKRNLNEKNPDVYITKINPCINTLHMAYLIISSNGL